MINTLIDTVVGSVKKGDEVRLQGFGTFRSIKTKARNGVNPRNPSEKIQIKAGTRPTFRAGSEFKKAVNPK